MSSKKVSFEKDHVGDNNCVCDVLQFILDAQDDTNGNGCTSGCAQFLVNPVQTVNTVPFILITKKNTVQFAFGDLPENDCFITVYFRINALDDCCATLELLEPNPGRAIQTGDNCCVPLNQVCGAGGDLELTRTGQCITVDLDCICAVQCFDPTVVV
ncbi:spore coat protein [Gracilibacillus salitolerans]|uniref:Spore coat protein n=1 Tax=Gracilibacillus salitolerans TaxID=2663022 RepID=A0A5Q2THU4_9BACI|nr:CotY/CotZ family spore coat protein [Gracilibacillus salitolerans]QGH34255.1 spore coat protein [Gracilibacillus salitolerans]